MSEIKFKCKKCNNKIVLNCGKVIEGCSHRNPQKSGTYMCVLRTKDPTGVVTTIHNNVIFKKGEWQIKENSELLTWKFK